MRLNYNGAVAAPTEPARSLAVAAHVVAAPTTTIVIPIPNRAHRRRALITAPPTISRADASTPTPNDHRYRFPRRPRSNVSTS
jgi:hypothetical protein